VEKTSSIKSLVVVEESGIAKGIRRMVAFTGERAREVQVEAQAFSEELTRIEKLPLGSEKEVAAKGASVKLAGLTISTLEKATLQDRLNKVRLLFGYAAGDELVSNHFMVQVQKHIVDEQKKRQKAESKTALQTVQDFFQANPDSTVFVGHLGISANMKGKHTPRRHVLIVVIY
jgi:alanyl-tRNA synthetase